MAYRYVFTPQCKDDLDDLTKRQHPLLMRIVVEVIPRILQDPHTVSERKSGQLKDCYGFVLSASGAALRLVYTIRGDTVAFLAVGRHDTVYKDAEKRIE